MKNFLKKLAVPLIAALAVASSVYAGTVLFVGQGGTGNSGFPNMGILVGAGGANSLNATTSPTVGYITATTTTASTLTGGFTALASSTLQNFSAANGTSTQFAITGLPSALPSTAANGALIPTTVSAPLSFTNNTLSCGACATTGLTYDWIQALNFGVLNLRASTTIPVWVNSQFYASSTSRFSGLATFDSGALMSGTLAASSTALFTNGFTAYASSTLQNFSAGAATILGNSSVTGTLAVSSTLTASNGFTVTTGSVSLPSASIADAALSSNVALLNRTPQTFSGANNIFSGAFQASSTALFGSNVIHYGSTTLQAFSAGGTASFLASVGVSSSTPGYALSIGSQPSASYGSIVTAENVLATSTSMTVDWTKSNQQLLRIGTAATSVTWSNVYAGATMRLIVCNPPGSSAGALTFNGTQWLSGGTVPTQTTTANVCDIWSFVATNATSSIQVFGAMTPNYP